MKKTAIILGATGLTGSIILNKLIADDRYATIKLFSRKEVKGTPLKVTQFIGDLLKLEDFTADFTADEVYCCIGTTTKKTPDKTRYRNIDFGIPVAAAKLSKANGIPAFLVVSAIGAKRAASIIRSTLSSATFLPFIALAAYLQFNLSNNSILLIVLIVIKS